MEFLGEEKPSGNVNSDSRLLRNAGIAAIYAEQRKKKGSILFCIRSESVNKGILLYFPQLTAMHDIVQERGEIGASAQSLYLETIEEERERSRLD